VDIKEVEMNLKGSANRKMNQVFLAAEILDLAHFICTVLAV